MTDRESNHITIVKRIKSFLKERIGMNTPEEAIFFENLEISGLDCYSLMEEFGEYFEVDMATFNPSHYRMGDPVATLRDVFQRSAKKSFDIYHMAKVVEAGYWYDPDEH